MASRLREPNTEQSMDTTRTYEYEKQPESPDLTPARAPMPVLAEERSVSFFNGDVNGSTGEG